MRVSYINLKVTVKLERSLSSFCYARMRAFLNVCMLD